MLRGFGAGGKGNEGEAPSAGRFLQLLNKNNTFYAYFGQNSYFKVITHQLKAFKISLNVLNRINEIQVLLIRTIVTKYDVTFATKGVPILKMYSKCIFTSTINQKMYFH